MNKNSSKEENTSFLLALIPPTRREPFQIATSETEEPLPTYQFLRDPFTINELESYTEGDGVFVWRDNGALVLISNGFEAPFSTKLENFVFFPLASYRFVSLVTRRMPFWRRLFSLGLYRTLPKVKELNSASVTVRT